jgi:hypothetical protein
MCYLIVWMMSIDVDLCIVLSALWLQVRSTTCHYCSTSTSTTENHNIPPIYVQVQGTCTTTIPSTSSFIIYILKIRVWIKKLETSHISLSNFKINNINEKIIIQINSICLSLLRTSKFVEGNLYKRYYKYKRFLLLLLVDVGCTCVWFCLA